MNLHEYQSRDLLSQYSINFPKGEVGSSPNEIYEIVKKFNSEVVVKAQIHSGGRGKAGGVKLCKTANDAQKFASEIIGKRIITDQTDSGGVIVEKLLVTELTNIKKEIYLSIIIDPDIEGPVMIASSEGGMDIEKIAEESPEKIIKVTFDPILGLKPYQIRQITHSLGIPKKSVGSFYNLVKNLHNAFLETDSTLIEIKPVSFR